MTMKDAAASIGALARCALLAEAEAAPKPGLVDPVTSGAHPDMDISTFRASAAALEPFFIAFARRGLVARGAPPDALLAGIRPLGLEAEAAMLQATGGINTHKGAIFLFGVLCFACGRLASEGAPLTADAACGEAARLARPALAELPALASAMHESSVTLESGVMLESGATLESSVTHGLRAYRLTGARGARGEAAEGFPHVRALSLPAYRALLSSGVSENDALCHTLMTLIAAVDDTNALARGGTAGAAYARAAAADFLARFGGYPGSAAWRAALTVMDADFAARKLTHGGCADLLAVTWFLNALEQSAL